MAAKTPQEAYEPLAIECVALCEEIREAFIERFPAPDCEERSITWPEVGTVGEIARQLRAVLAFAKNEG
jgi:hypothetical protein